MTAGARILVTDGEQRATLASVRAWGRAGYRVQVCASRKGALATGSRYCERAWIVPESLDEPANFAAEVLRAAREGGADVVVPVSESAVLALLPRRAEFTAVIPFPSLDAFRQICDKRLVVERAPSHGLLTPSQVVVEAKGAGSPRNAALRYPVVLKPTRSVVEAGQGRAKTAVTYARNEAELSEKLESLPESAYPVLVQERVIGYGAAISLLLWNGHTVAAFAHRRLREKPPSGGVSVLREAIPLDPILLERAADLLADFDWCGVAMVEFKVSAATGDAYIMEVNGRLWGSLQLAIDAGIDFPTILVQCALGQDVRPALTYRIGVRSQWEWGDIDHLLAVLRHSAQQLAMPPGSVSRWRTLMDVTSTFVGPSRGEVLRWCDPMPFMRESIDWLRRK